MKNLLSLIVLSLSIQCVSADILNHEFGDWVVSTDTVRNDSYLIGEDRNNAEVYYIVSRCAETDSMDILSIESTTDNKKKTYTSLMVIDEVVSRYKPVGAVYMIDDVNNEHDNVQLLTFTNDKFKPTNRFINSIGYTSAIIAFNNQCKINKLA